MQKAYRYRFYPTCEQEILLRRTMGCARLVYNRALAARTEAWYERKERIGYVESSAMLTSWKKEEELSFLNEVSCVPLQQGLRHLQSAFSNFFAGKAKYPNFKKKHSGGSAEYTKSAFKFSAALRQGLGEPGTTPAGHNGGQLFLAKCKEALPVVWSRPLPDGAEPSTITVRLLPSGQWYISLLVDIEIAELPKLETQVGIDLGINSLAVLSTGEKIANPKTLKQKQAKLRRAQKALSRKQKGSNNRYKARLKVAKIYQGIGDARKDFLHKLTTRLVRENQTICLETLAIKNMVKNHKLAKSISDASWSELVRQVTYKSEWYGRELIKIDRWFPSSKLCETCHHIVEKLPLSIREWTCPKCQAVQDRDINAARNILAAGLAVSVCGADIRPDRVNPKGQSQ